MYDKIPTYDELMVRTDVHFISEYDGHLYVKLPPTEYYDDTIWKVDKKTHQVSYMAYTKYMCTVMDKAQYIKKPDWEK